MDLIRVFLVIMLGSCVSGWADFKLLPVENIPSIKKNDCAFIHVWATWCEACVQELPRIIQLLKGEPRAQPFVIDVSSPTVQENFSKKWDVTRTAPFTMYLKPKGPDENYLKAIDPQWKRALPFSVLYHRGKKVKSWVGLLPIQEAQSQMQLTCVKSSK